MMRFQVRLPSQSFDNFTLHIRKEKESIHPKTMMLSFLQFSIAGIISCHPPGQTDLHLHCWSECQRSQTEQLPFPDSYICPLLSSMVENVTLHLHFTLFSRKGKSHNHHFYNFETFYFHFQHFHILSNVL